MLSEREERLVVVIQGLVHELTRGACYETKNPYARPRVKKALKEALKEVKDIACLQCENRDVFKGDPFPMEVPDEFRRNPEDSKCPKCGGLLMYSSVDYEARAYSQDIGCQDCGFEFMDIYPYSHSMIMEDGNAGDNKK